MFIYNMNIKNIFGDIPSKTVIEIFMMLRSRDFDLLINRNIERPIYYSENIIYNQNAKAKLLKRYYKRCIKDLDNLLSNAEKANEFINYFLLNFNSFGTELDYIIKIFDEYYEDQDIETQLQVIRTAVLNYYCLKKFCKYILTFYNSNIELKPTTLDNFIMNSESLIHNVVNYYSSINKSLSIVAKDFYKTFLNI